MEPFSVAALAGDRQQSLQKSQPVFYRNRSARGAAETVIFIDDGLRFVMPKRFNVPRLAARFTCDCFIHR